MNLSRRTRAFVLVDSVVALAVLAVGLGVVLGNLRQAVLNTEWSRYNLEGLLAVEYARLVISERDGGLPIRLTERFTLMSAETVEQIGDSVSYQIVLRDIDGKTLERRVWVSID